MATQDPQYTDALVAAEASVLAKHGYVKEDGDVDEVAIEDKLLARLLSAEAHSIGERRTVAVSRPSLMAEVYPNLSDAFDVDGDDVGDDLPGIEDMLYARLSTGLWQKLSMNPTGPIQQRLNGEHSLVLCRTTIKPDNVDAVYVTRDGNCIDEDYWAPEMKSINATLGRAARKAALVAERVPSHGPKLARSLKSSTRRALESAEETVAAAIESTTGGGDAA